MEYREFTGKTVEDAVVEAAVQLGTTSDRMESVSYTHLRDWMSLSIIGLRLTGFTKL